jgi:hypothetical protein
MITPLDDTLLCGSFCPQELCEQESHFDSLHIHINLDRPIFSVLEFGQDPRRTFGIDLDAAP